MKHLKYGKFLKVGILALGLSLPGLIPSSFAQTDNDTGMTNTTREDDSNWGWIGLLGLAGLAGLMRRDKDRSEQRTEHHTRI